MTEPAGRETTCKGYPDENAFCTVCGRGEDAHVDSRCDWCNHPSADTTEETAVRVNVDDCIRAPNREATAMYRCLCGCGRAIPKGATWDGMHGPAYDQPVTTGRETPVAALRRKFDAGQHTCQDGCPQHGRVVCGCVRRCRPCEAPPARETP